MSDTAIELHQVTKRFGPKILSESVSMTFDPGKRYALVGANGSGKTTLATTIMGHPRYKVTELNWRDNPKFPTILDRQRLRDNRELLAHPVQVVEIGFVTRHEQRNRPERGPRQPRR